MPGHRMDAPTTTVERLGIKPGVRIWMGGHNVAAKAEIEPHLTGTERPPEGPIDLAFIAPQTCDEAVYFAGKLRRRLSATGVIWVLHPNSRSPHRDTFTGNLDDIAVGLFELGFMEVGAAPIGNDFTALGFRPGGGLVADAPM